MAFALRSLFLLCGISGLLTGVSSFSFVHRKVNNCPPHWTQLDCNCYIYQDDVRTAADAESVCNIIGGNLVSIHDALENAFVQKLAQAGDNDDVFWLGLSDAVLDDTYIWTDGTTNDFENFDTTNSEPDGTTGDCVTMDEDDGLWQTADCTDEEAYVCIREVYYSH
ncbi:snaclec 6-like [Vanacampus margaritifer]